MTRAQQTTDRATRSAHLFSNAMKGLVAGVSIAQGGVGALIGVWLALTNPILGTVAALSAFAISGVRARASMETLEVGLTNMLGSAEAAQAQLGRLVEFAAKTPFELEGLGRAHQQLIAFGFGQKGALETLRLIGDTVASTGRFSQQGIEMMVRAFGRIRTGGPMGEAFESLSRFGITQQTLEDFGIEIGKGNKVLSDRGTVLAALADLIESKYGGMMEDISSTVMGKASNLKDALFQMFATVGEPLEPFIKGLLDGVIGMAAKIGDLFKVFMNSKVVRDFADAWRRLSRAMHPIRGILLDFLKIMGGTVIVAFMGLLRAIADLMTRLSVKLAEINQKLIDFRAGLVELQGPLKVIVQWFSALWQNLKSLDFTAVIQQFKDLLINVFGEDSFLVEVAEVIFEFINSRIEFAEELTMRDFLKKLATALTFVTVVGLAMRVRLPLLLFLALSTMFTDPEGDKLNDIVVMSGLGLALGLVFLSKAKGFKFLKPLGLVVTFATLLMFQDEKGDALLARKEGLKLLAILGFGVLGTALGLPPTLSLTLGTLITLGIPDDWFEYLDEWVGDRIRDVKAAFEYRGIQFGIDLDPQLPTLEEELIEIGKNLDGIAEAWFMFLAFISANPDEQVEVMIFAFKKWRQDLLDEWGGVEQDADKGWVGIRLMILSHLLGLETHEVEPAMRRINEAFSNLWVNIKNGLNRGWTKIIHDLKANINSVLQAIGELINSTIEMLNSPLFTVGGLRPKIAPIKIPQLDVDSIPPWGQDPGQDPDQPFGAPWPPVSTPEFGLMGFQGVPPVNISIGNVDSPSRVADLEAATARGVRAALGGERYFQRPHTAM